MIYYTAAGHGNGTVGFISSTFGKVSVAKVGGDYWVGFKASKFDPPQKSAIYVGSATGDVSNPIISYGMEDEIVGGGSCATIMLIDAGIPPHMNSSGLATFFCTVGGSSGGCPTLDSILGKTSGGPHVILAQEGMVPNGGSQALTGVHRDFGLCSNGVVAFRGIQSTGTGIWESASGGIRDVAKTGDSAVGSSTGTSFNVFGGVGPDALEIEPDYGTAGSGYVGAFRPNLMGGGAGSATRGVWKVSGGVTGVPPTLTFIADDTTDAPGTFPAIPFIDFHAPNITASGVVAFQACLETANCSNDGIWKGSDPTSLVLVALHGKPAVDEQGNQGTLNYGAFGNPSVNQLGHVAFKATYESGGDGLWAESVHDPDLALIARSGDPIFGTNLTIVSIGSSYLINNADQLAFTATVTDGATVTNGLFFVTPGLTAVFKVIRESENYRVGPGISKTVNFLDFYAGPIDQGSSGFTHDGVLAYRVNFTDGTRAIVLTVINT